jgi:hypothetical protein
LRRSRSLCSRLLRPWQYPLDPFTCSLRCTLGRRSAALSQRWRARTQAIGYEEADKATADGSEQGFRESGVTSREVVYRVSQILGAIQSECDHLRKIFDNRLPPFGDVLVESRVAQLDALWTAVLRFHGSTPSTRLSALILA